MSVQIVPMFYPAVPSQAIAAVAKVLRSRWIGQGAMVAEFEKQLEQTLHIPGVVAVNTASSALRLALVLSGVQPGDEVITTPLTCTLTNHPILEQFATPVFSDIQETTGNIDPSDVEHRITPKTKAILCTHWGGMPCDLSELQAIATRHNIPVIEDGSEAMGATYHGQPVGAISPFTAFSFQAIQMITTAEGGALAISSPQNKKKAKMYRWYGIDREQRKKDDKGYYDFDITHVGFGYHMTNIAAAIGLAGISRLPKMLKQHERIAALYRKKLRNIPGVTLLAHPEDRTATHHFFTILVKKRKDFVRKMQEQGIETSIVHYRNDAYTVFGGLRKDLPNLDTFSRSYIALPNHSHLRLEDVERIISVMRSGW